MPNHFYRKEYKLTFCNKQNHKKYVEYTNVSDINQSLFHLCKKGYGSYKELKSLSVIDVLDMLEFEHISADIANHLNTNNE